MVLYGTPAGYYQSKIIVEPAPNWQFVADHLRALHSLQWTKPPGADLRIGIIGMLRGGKNPYLRYVRVSRSCGALTVCFSNPIEGTGPVISNTLSFQQKTRYQ